MATQLETLEAALVQLKSYNALTSPTAAQQTTHQKLLGQCMARLIFLLQNHPDDTP